MAKAFISYSHRDEKALERLHTHLATLRREGSISAWYDREILAGDDIDRKIDAALAESEIFLALVSPDFLASNYCYEREMASALERHADGSLRVVPIILEPCDWKSTPLANLKVLPKDGKPISTWTNENVAYLDVVTELRRITSIQTANTPQEGTRGQRPIPAKREGRRYRIKKEFDSIDRDEFRHKSFETICEFFRASIDELNEIGELIRARFERINGSAFSCTILNKASSKEAHITVRADAGEHLGGEMSFSFARRASPNTANGFVHVEANDYELYLRLDNFASRGRDKEALSAEQVAGELWREFTSHAGIDHE
ncbi:MAG: toll/interleukin-1 receptor domain-containing protein [Bradyrhizobium sp.]|uniref:toll/interleukin-1 receptor domain-containing protein n=1 Tax=Bradyrhizobium sp. TaxID=376 RepID=UPI0025C0DECF|nr:toll/interleukin-1 receptor domain-containing protein [Bradyrhizobium sp.]MBI5260337.1 toll/interleukin-1 receptor domain-containing protein [Bradyrhizobium sp.]